MWLQTVWQITSQVLHLTLEKLDLLHCLHGCRKLAIWGGGGEIWKKPVYAQIWIRFEHGKNEFSKVGVLKGLFKNFGSREASMPPPPKRHQWLSLDHKKKIPQNKSLKVSFCGHWSSSVFQMCLLYIYALWVFPSCFTAARMIISCDIHKTILSFYFIYLTQWHSNVYMYDILYREQNQPPMNNFDRIAQNDWKGVAAAKNSQGGHWMV